MKLDYKTNLTEEDFKKSLLEITFSSNELELLKVLYESLNQSSTGLQLKRLLGKDNNGAINLAFSRIAKKITKSTNIYPSSKRENGQYRWWSMLAIGERIGSNFLWQLRPELVSAIEKVNLFEDAIQVKDMTIREIAFKINELSINYSIGKLQSMRKDIKNLQRKPAKSIFHDKSISEEGWAFHYGGRKELQFNIGFEKEGLRYGLGFSLETSQSLPDISILFPKIYKLNCIIREEPQKFKTYNMLHWKNGSRSEIYSVSEIKPELINNETFIFFGKIENINDLDFNEVLTTFDELLEIYLEVENSKYGKLELIEKVNLPDFEFVSKNRKLSSSREYNSTEKAINIEIRHTLLQEKLIEDLRLEYGFENVSYENPLNGKKIDVVVRSKEGYIFFEIKTGSSVKACIREAIGQLLEYAFWGGKEYANKIVIASEYKLNNDAEKYLDLLKQRFGLPIEYRRIKIEN